MSASPLGSGDREPNVNELYALLAGIAAAAEGEVRVPDRALMAAQGRSLHIYRDDARQCIVLKLAADVATRAPNMPAVEAWEDTFVGGVPPELRG